MLAVMIARALGVLLLLAFAMAPAAACCAPAASITTSVSSHHHGGHAPADGPARPHDAAKAACGALAGIAPAPGHEIDLPRTAAIEPMTAGRLGAEGRVVGPTAPPPRTA